VARPHGGSRLHLEHQPQYYQTHIHQQKKSVFFATDFGKAIPSLWAGTGGFDHNETTFTTKSFNSFINFQHDAR